MSCGDVLNIEDLRTAKRNQVFEAEVITGKKGGVSGGADIDYAVNQNTGQVQKTLPAILRDVGFTPASFDFATGGTLTADDRDKAVYDPVSNTWYTYKGTLPVTIAAGTNPVGNADWSPITDVTIRQEYEDDRVNRISATVNTIADLRALDKTKYSRATVLGYYAPGDGGGGQYYMSTPSAEAGFDNGGSQITATDGAAWSLVHSGVMTLQQFGAKGDGTTDDAEAIQRAFDATEDGSILRALPGSNYKVGTGIVWTKAVLLEGTRTDHSTNPNGSVLQSFPRFTWAGNEGGYILTQKPAAEGECVWGGGVVGVELDGMTTAACCVHLDNTVGARVEVKTRNTRYAGVVVDSDSGTPGAFSNQNIIDVTHVWGTQTVCEASHGVICGGNGGTVAATQQLVKNVSGLFKHGFALVLAEVDNCVVEFINAALQFPANGGGVWLRQPGAQPANHNVIIHCAGRILQDPGVFGTRIVHFVSEGGGINNSGQGLIDWNGDVTDYGTGRVFTGHKYQLRKKISVPVGAFLPGPNVTTERVASLWSCYGLPPSGAAISACIPADFDLSDGYITGIEVFYNSATTESGNGYAITVSASSVTDTETATVVTPERAASYSLPSGGQYRSMRAVHDFPTPLPYKTGDSLYLQVRRDSGDGNSGTLCIMGVRVLYVSTGPVTPGSGSTYVPQWD